jgi:iron-sulfur cluster repair protein YtfE (RIC family)
MFTPSSTLGELVAERPEAARVLHRHGLDFCCGGGRSIESALKDRELTLPPSACASWTALYQGPETLELELMEHIHLENNILFPRALVEEL